MPMRKVPHRFRMMPQRSCESRALFGKRAADPLTKDRPSRLLLVLPEILRKLAPSGARVRFGEIFHASGRKTARLVREWLDRNLKRHRTGQRQIGALVQGELRTADRD